MTVDRFVTIIRFDVSILTVLGFLFPLGSPTRHLPQASRILFRRLFLSFSKIGLGCRESTHSGTTPQDKSTDTDAARVRAALQV